MSRAASSGPTVGGTVTSLADAAWPEVRDDTVLLVPVGSLEQHGPHLPMDTDAVVAQAVAAGMAEAIGERASVAPVVAYGSSGEHQSFPGTLSIGTEALRLLLVELVRSASTWASRTVLVNGHGGNLDALSGAVAQLVEEGHHVTWVPCESEHVDLHAGVAETSLLLHLRPWAVRAEEVRPGDTRPLAEILPLMRAGGVAAVSPGGVLGDPTGSTAERGAALLDDMVARALGRLAQAWAEA